jgi:hypothetical protein
MAQDLRSSVGYIHTAFPTETSGGSNGPTQREDGAMADTTITKIDSKFSPTGAMGQKYLASGVHIAMRLWEDEPPGTPKAATQREYEIGGYVIKGRAQLEIEG